jgi:hypothetical protein
MFSKPKIQWTLLFMTKIKGQDIQNDQNNVTYFMYISIPLTMKRKMTNIIFNYNLAQDPSQFT